MKVDQQSDSANANSGIDRKRRRLIQATGGALAAGLTLPFSASVIGESLEFDRREIDVLQRAMKGTVVPRGTPVYEPWRRSMAWNYRKFGRYPDVIVQAESEQDVVATINFARRNRLPIKTRTGGHSWSGCYMRDSGILLDLSRFQSVEIDPAARTAIIGAGVLGRDLATRLGNVGLAFPTAHCGMVPLSGFLLGGGLGLNCAVWGGMSVFNIQAIDVVTADGQFRHASADENPDLFWAARGAGPGLFFTVTRFYLRCYALPGAITTDTYILPYSELLATVALMEELGPDMNPAVEMLTVVVPATPELARKCSTEECERVVVLSAIAFADSPAEAKSMLAPIRRHPLTRNSLEKILDRPSPFEVLYQDNEGPFPQRRARADNIYTNRAVDAARVLSRHMPAAPSPGNTPVILYHGEHKFRDAAYSATGRFYFAGYAQWDDAADDLANQAWLRKLYDEMQPFASGFYINEFDRETRSAQTQQCFAKRDWQRLQDLRRQYDPNGVFHDFLKV